AITSAAAHDREASARWRQLPQRGRRCPAASLAQHHTRLRQARQPEPAIGRVAVASWQQFLQGRQCHAASFAQISGPAVAREGRMSQPLNLRARVRQYLRERRRLGFQLRSMGYALRSFAHYVDKLENPGPLTVEMMAAWARCDRAGSKDRKSTRLNSSHVSIS